MTLQAFHGQAAIKEKYVNRIRAHMAADTLIRGVGWEDGKGCAVGCTLETYDHSRYPVELGVPEWLARVEDKVFENMSIEKSRTWPLDFLSAIEPGADLERIKGLFLIVILKSALETFDHIKFPQVKDVIGSSLALWQRSDINTSEYLSATEEVLKTAWPAAEAGSEGSTRAAAWAAGAAAEAAAWEPLPTWVASATEAAGAAWEYRPTCVPTTANEQSEAAFDYFADELLKLLAAVPMTETIKGCDGGKSGSLRSLRHICRLHPLSKFIRRRCLAPIPAPALSSKGRNEYAIELALPRR